jgi:hypothetical protein
VEPDLVMRMMLGGLSDGHFSYGPSFPGLPREPFSNERHMFGDSQLHTCEPYLEMERKFFSDNMEIMRENYFDVDLPLGEDPVEDLAVEEAINYDDLVPVRSAEEILWQITAANDIANMEIVRLAPDDSDSENEGTTERVTAPVVVEAAGESVDAGEATGPVGLGANNASALVAAAGGDNVGEVVDGRDEALSGPGLSGGDASMDDFLPRPRPWFLPFLSSSDAAGDEVILLYAVILRLSGENSCFLLFTVIPVRGVCIFIVL